MLSAKSDFARLFRPWDAKAETTVKVNKRDGRLRKVRNVTKRNKTQDDTISTTTKEEGAINIVENLTKFCDRVLPDDPNAKPVKEDFSIPETYPQNYSHIPHDFFMTFQEQLSMESLAQSYAFEMEYNRILCEESRLKMLNSKKQRPKKFKCPVCDVGFSNNGQLKGHIRIHNGERPFKCDEPDCGKAFTRNEELTRHKRIHSGIKPYPCQTCGKKFGRRDHLKKHTRTHFVTVDKMMPMFVPYVPPYPWGLYSH